MNKAIGPKRSKGFRDKYLAPIMIAAAVFIGFNSYSQDNDLDKYTYYRYLYGNKTDRVSAEKVLMTPKDTIYSKDGIAVIDTSIYIGDGVKWTRVVGGLGSGKDSLNQLNDTEVDDAYEVDALLFDSTANKWKASSVYFRSMLSLLYSKDTLGVKIVRSFHAGYRTGEIQLQYESAGTADYITSWPSKNFSGIWKRIDFKGVVNIDLLGAIGNLNAMVTPDDLGYDVDDLEDLYGTYFTKSVDDYIDEIALNQMIYAQADPMKYRNFELGRTRYHYKNKLIEFPYFSEQNYDVINIKGNASELYSVGGKYTAFWRYPQTFAQANLHVQGRYYIEDIKFIQADTAISIHPSYRSTVNLCHFRDCRYGVVLRWDMAAQITNNNFDNFDSVGLWVDRMPLTDVGTIPQSNYWKADNNRFYPNNSALRSIYIFRSNGGYLTQTIFEGGNPEYNVYIDVQGGNNREMRISSVHVENIPDSACIKYKGNNTSLYLDKIYHQTNCLFVDASNIDSIESVNPAIIFIDKTPYFGRLTNLFKSYGAKWYLKDVPAFDIDSSYVWANGYVPAAIEANFSNGYINKDPTTFSFTSPKQFSTLKYFQGDYRFFGKFSVPIYTDTTTRSAILGAVHFNNQRSKFYGGISGWQWLLDSTGFLNPTRAATANSQTLVGATFNPTFTNGAFTGLNNVIADFRTSLAGFSPYVRIYNTSSSANSRAMVEIVSNNSGTGQGGLRLFNDGSIQQIFPNVPITLLGHATGGSIIFKPQSTTKGTWNNTGLRIGDANLPEYSLDIVGKGKFADTLLGTRGVFSRPSGYSAVFTMANLANDDWITKKIFQDSITVLRDSITALRAAINSGGGGSYPGDGALYGFSSYWLKDTHNDMDGQKTFFANTFLHRIVIRSSVNITLLKIGTSVGGDDIWSGPVTADDTGHPNDIVLNVGIWMPVDTTIYFTGLDGTGGTMRVWYHRDTEIDPIID